MNIMSLSDLPDDILNLISIRLNGFDNCSLWMASDSKLRQRLANNVITDFDIKYTIPGRYLWPGNFLKKRQKLSHLSLVLDKRDLFHLPMQNVEIFAIPTLKYLRLGLANPHHIFSTNSTGLLTLSKSYINLNDFYPNLEHLEIIAPETENAFFWIEFLCCLPQNLKTLLILQTYFMLNDEDPTFHLNTHLKILPRTLTTLEIRFPYGCNAYLDFSNLPPNLTSLTTNAFVDQTSFHMIPKTLKSLLLVRNLYDLEKLSPFLPTGLESFSIAVKHPPSSQMFLHLRNLHTLYIDPQSQSQLDDLIINSPPKLQSFTCNRLVLTPSSLPPRLFSNCLTKLEMHNILGMDTGFISSLPESLIHLSMTQHRTYKKRLAFFSLLPRKLKSLTTNFYMVEKTSCLPESLTHLELTSASLEDDNISYFDRLPPKLETLTVVKYLPISILKQLPESLTDLFINSDETVDDDVVRMLPRGLKHLALYTPDDITDAGAVDLPPYLEKLTLDNNTKMTDNTIPLLPRSLIELYMPLNPNFTDECIKHLPPKLTSLSLSEATQITSNSSKYLPKYLHSLSLSLCHDWDPDILVASKNELPQFMQSFFVGNVEATRTWAQLVADRKLAW